MYTANTDRLHQRWTRQLLRGSALLPRFSTLKLVRLPLASGASLRLALGPTPTDNDVMLYRKGGRNRERNCRIPFVGEPKFYSWGRCTIALTNMHSDLRSNPSSNLCINLYYRSVPFATLALVKKTRGAYRYGKVVQRATVLRANNTGASARV